MWLHTTLNHQYKHGTTMSASLRTLWREGGVWRLYRGLPYALLLSPATRFMDTGANAGCMAFLDGHAETAGMSMAAKTACGSIVASTARITLMPLDVLKTVMQVRGADGWTVMRDKFQAKGSAALFQGGIAATAASTVSHFPWFYVVRSACLPAPA